MVGLKLRKITIMDFVPLSLRHSIGWAHAGIIAGVESEMNIPKPSRKRYNRVVSWWLSCAFCFADGARFLSITIKRATKTALVFGEGRQSFNIDLVAIDLIQKSGVMKYINVEMGMVADAIVCCWIRHRLFYRNELMVNHHSSESVDSKVVPELVKKIPFLNY
ncbi:hypothetical protein TNCV_2087541 [Trichonephila clavipes]|nr:hypothetical protein TNCV_2087541 [Trichonephila clavipes]